MTPQRYRLITTIALGALVAIVITGASVRLTGSGLGCSDWPTCSEESFVPEGDLHGIIEFVNRLFTGVVSAAVIAAVLGSLRRAPRRRDLTWLSLGLVAGVIGQVLLGAVTVLSKLRPEIVMAHFLLSMVLVWNAVWLRHRAGVDDAVYADPSPPCASARLRLLAMASATLSAIVIFAGTIVTAAGPHAGDENVDRLAVDLPDAARVHGAMVWVLIGLVLALMVATETEGPDGAFRRQVRTFGLIVMAQGTLGYVQYFSDIPALLVGFHIAGACAVWIAAVALALSTRSSAAPTREPQVDREPVSA